MVAVMRASRARAAAIADGSAPPALLAAVERVAGSVDLGPDTLAIVRGAASGLWARGVDGVDAEVLTGLLAADVEQHEAPDVRKR